MIGFSTYFSSILCIILCVWIQVDMGFAPDLAQRALTLAGGDLSAAAIKLAYGEVQ